MTVAPLDRKQVVNPAIVKKKYSQNCAKREKTAKIRAELLTYAPQNQKNINCCVCHYLEKKKKDGGPQVHFSFTAKIKENQFRFTFQVTEIMKRWGAWVHYRNEPK